MTVKEFKKRVTELLNDSSSYVLDGDKLEMWKKKQKEISAR